MTTRLLPMAEWDKLAEALGPLWSSLPDGSRPVVVEQDGAIVGCHVLLPVWHLEGLWIAEAHRGKSSVARRLWAGVQTAASVLHVPRVVTAASDDRVKGLLSHIGATALPEHFLIELEGPCR